MITDKEKTTGKIAPEQFEFVNKNINYKIHDEKFKTKPTTFAKDAFKRFCKNKSSVVAACIIGFMLVGSVVFPLISNDDLKTVKMDQNFLPPKLFNAGAGWWDGTRTFKRQIIDRHLMDDDGFVYPASNGEVTFRRNAIRSMKTSDVDYVDVKLSSPFAYDGSIVYKADKLPDNVEPIDKPFWVRNYTTFKLSKDDDVKVEFGFDNTDNILDSHPAEQYRFSIYEVIGGTDVLFDYLTDWVPYQQNVTLDLSAKLEERGVDKINKAKICVEALQKKYDGADTTSYMLINKIKFSCAETTDEAIADQFANMSFFNRTDKEVADAHKEGLKAYDANASFSINLDDKDVDLTCYYQSTAKKYCYNAKVRYVDVVYDMYEHVYGVRKMVIGGSLLQKYIDNGWCRLKNLALKIDECPKNYITLEEYPFEILDKKCPIESIKSVRYIKTEQVTAWEFDCDVSYYKYKGMTSVPRFIMGTDIQGFDMWTMCFNSLKTSLLVAIICVAICLAIGLVWGAISGYFGGTVDLVMERVTDILAGLPSIILMTLMLIIIGRNIYTFALSIIITGWIGTASLTRTQFYRFRDREYVLASRTLGASDARLIFRHILPNGLGTIITSSVLRVPTFIASEATIAYLGIGLKTTDSFGVILSSNQIYINSHPHLIAFPAILLALLMISFNLFGNGLRDAVNPTLKGGE